MKRRNNVVAAGLAGLVFGFGLIVGGMTQPSKVIGFLDLAGDWDPSLAFVMGGAIAVFLPLLRLITRRRSAPLFAATFALPTRRDIDAPLVVGAALFGVGWGLGGFCPGPALTSLGSVAPTPLLFVASMVFGFGLKRGFDGWRVRREARSAEAPASTPILEK